MGRFEAMLSRPMRAPVTMAGHPISLLKCDERALDYLVPKVTAQLLGCSQVDLVAAKYV